MALALISVKVVKAAIVVTFSITPNMWALVLLLTVSLDQA